MTRCSEGKQTYSCMSLMSVVWLNFCNSVMRNTNMATLDNWDLSSGDKRVFFFFSPWVTAAPPFRDLKDFCGLMIAVNVLSLSYILYFILFPILPHAGMFKWLYISIYSRSNLFHLLHENRMVLVANMDNIRFVKLEVKVWSQIRITLRNACMP